MNREISSDDSRPARRWSLALVVPAIVLGVAALLWSSGVVYWHLRIRAVLRDLRGTEERSRAAQLELVHCGSRSLPYLMEEYLLASEGADRVWELRAFYFLRRVVDRAEAKGCTMPSSLPAIQMGDAESERRKKREQVLQWWNSEKRSYPGWWEFWNEGRRD